MHHLVSELTKAQPASSSTYAANLLFLDIISAYYFANTFYIRVRLRIG